MEDNNYPEFDKGFISLAPSNQMLATVSWAQTYTYMHSYNVCVSIFVWTVFAFLLKEENLANPLWKQNSDEF